MKAWVLTGQGGPEVLEQRDIEVPAASADEVRIAVRAFGINAAERYRRLGFMGPIEGLVVPGIEAVGEVLEDPSGTFEIGARVATIMGGLQFDRTGSYAEQVVVLRSNVVPLPTTGLSWTELAALPQSYITAWGAIDRDLGIKHGETIVVRGASAALGLSAVAYASAILGARVIGTVKDAATIDTVMKFGADEVLVESDDIVSDVLTTAGGPVDGLLDIVGGPGIVASSKMVRSFRKVAVVGLLAGPPVLENVNIMESFGPAVSVGFFPSQLVGTPVLPIADAPLAAIAEAVEAGQIPSQVAYRYTFDEVPAVHQLLDGDRKPGKVVVTL